MTEKYCDLLDKMQDLNAILEVCHGYTQSDVPNMKTLDLTLYFLLTRYEQLYNEFLQCKNVAGA